MHLDPVSLRSKLVSTETRAGGAAVTQALVTTKLRAPRTRPNLVARPRLREALALGEGRRLTLVSAPAGFGKTTLLSEWATEGSEGGRSVAWVSLEDSDNDPARFLTYWWAHSRRSKRGSAREFWPRCVRRSCRTSRR